MSRLVTPVKVGVRAYADKGTKENLNTLTERVAKYVPAELIALYLGVLPILEGTTNGGTDRKVAFGILFVGCWILSPVYMFLLAKRGEPRRIQAVMAFIAFFVWAYSIGGFMTEISLHRAWVAVLLLAFFTPISALIAPTEGTA